MMFFVKRMVDLLVALIGLAFLSPFLVFVGFLIFLQDFKSPFYIANRIGRQSKPFKMVKFRSMVMDADKAGVDSTAQNDPRITPIGRFVRKWKLDEFPQLWNVLMGDMSLVGPRPNVHRHGVELYTQEEMKLLNVRPGITDFSSIIFSDEAEILMGSEDADLKYNRVIRPWKSRLGIFYVDHMGPILDLQIIFVTLMAILSKPRAIKFATAILTQLEAHPTLIQVSMRQEPLAPFPPPGAQEPVKFL